MAEPPRGFGALANRPACQRRNAQTCAEKRSSRRANSRRRERTKSSNYSRQIRLIIELSIIARLTLNI